MLEKLIDKLPELKDDFALKLKERVEQAMTAGRPSPVETIHAHLRRA